MSGLARTVVDAPPRRAVSNTYLVWAYREACFDFLECCFAGCHAVVIESAADVMRTRAAAIGRLWVGES